MLQRTLSRLTEEMETTHFRIRYVMRSPRTGSGIARHGVRDLSLVLRYAESLELGYSRMIAEPFNWKSVHNRAKTEVILFDTHGIFSGDFGRTVFLGDRAVVYLASCGNEPTLAGEFQRAAATAVHELSHVFTSSMYPDLTDDWFWFDEGTSMFMETYVYPENQDSLQYLLDWSNSPEASLDRVESCYQAGMFVRFLSKRYGTDLIGATWKHAALNADPFKSLEQAVKAKVKDPNLVFCSPEPGQPDVFASGYCVDGYFMSDPKSGCFSPEIVARYGERIICDGFHKYPFNDAAHTHMIDHLGCRYYRFCPLHAKKDLEVTLLPADADAAAYLRADLIPVSRAMKPGKKVPLVPNGSAKAPLPLQGRLEDFHDGSADHAVLIVSNCSYGAKVKDNLAYRISADLT